MRSLLLLLALAAPLHAGERHRELVDPAWLDAAISSRTVTNPPTGRLVVLHVEWDQAKQFKEGHIPGAVYLDTNVIEQPPSWNILPFDELAPALADLGVSADATVVVYGAGGRPGSPNIAATRAWLALRWAGVEDVRLLDGGLPAWRASGRPLEQGPVLPESVGSFGRDRPGHPELLLSITDAKVLAMSPDACLVSTRSRAEHEGKTSGYADIKTGGHVPGDVRGLAGSDAMHLDQLERPDGTLRDPKDVERDFAALGIGPSRRVAFYCGTGWRASEACFFAHLLGWPRIGVWDGGWAEWTRDPANPIARGP